MSPFLFIRLKGKCHCGSVAILNLRYFTDNYFGGWYADCQCKTTRFLPDVKTAAIKAKLRDELSKFAERMAKEAA